MSRDTPDTMALTACLRAELDALKHCVKILGREQQLLMDGDIDALADLNGLKTSLLESAARCSAIRERHLADRGLPVDTVGMTALLENGPGLREIWNEVLEWARQASDLNSVNGTLIDVRISHNRHALAVMHQAANSPATYGQDGHLQHASSGRAFGVG